MGLRHVSGCFPQNWIFLPWERWLKSTKSRLGGAILFLYGVIKNKVSPRTQKQHLFLAVGMVEADHRIRLAAVRHVLERYICRYESNPFNLTFLNISAHNEACLRLTLKHASYATSVHPRLPPFPPGSSPSANPSTSIS